MPLSIVGVGYHNCETMAQEYLYEKLAGRLDLNLKIQQLVSVTVGMVAATAVITFSLNIWFVQLTLPHAFLN